MALGMMMMMMMNSDVVKADRSFSLDCKGGVTEGEEALSGNKKKKKNTSQTPAGSSEDRDRPGLNPTLQIGAARNPSGAESSVRHSGHDAERERAAERTCATGPVPRRTRDAPQRGETHREREQPIVLLR